MGTNYKVLSDFEVATAEEAQDLFIDSSVVKVDADVDLDDLPTSVKTAYVLNTGILMARDAMDVWKPQGGAAVVSETEPSNPQVGQLWVKPSLVLPAPVRGYVMTPGVLQSITATSFADVPTTSAKSITLPKAAMCSVTMNFFLRIDATTDWPIQARVAWTGAATGNSESHMGGFGGVAYAGAWTGYNSQSLHFHVVLPEGTTSFKAQAMHDSGGSTVPQIANTAIEICPVAWADEYEAGVS